MSELKWRLHTTNFLQDIIPSISNAAKNVQIVNGLQLLQSLLGEVATRASQLHDEKLDELMGRLTLYGVCDPHDKEYDKEVCNLILDGKSHEAFKVLERKKT